MPLDEGFKFTSVVTDSPSLAISAGRARRTRYLAILLTGVAAAIALGYGLWRETASGRVETSDAYVQAGTAPVSALISGAITSAPHDETAMVRAGDVLATIEPADYRFAVDRATAELRESKTRVRQYFATERAMAAQARARTAQVAAAEAELHRAEVEYHRRSDLALAGAISADELTDSEAAFKTAGAKLQGARADAAAASEQGRSARIQLDEGDVEQHPEVLAARARLNQAELDLARTVVRSPVDGVIVRKTAEVGQKVAAGSALMGVVPIQKAYVEANFKEEQLRRVRIGQPVVLTSDLYGPKVPFHGRVLGLAGGTGSAFAVIPAQNASGNWIKVVQRLPVRIGLDDGELARHPLRVGLSMKAQIKLQDR